MSKLEILNRLLEALGPRPSCSTPEHQPKKRPPFVALQDLKELRDDLDRELRIFPWVN